MQLTYYVAPWDREPETDSKPDLLNLHAKVAYGPGEIRHGYTLTDIHDLAYAAVKRSHRFQGIDARDRIDAAWFAIVEFLLTCTERPRPYELIGAGMTGSDLLLTAHRRAHGYAYDDHWATPGTMPGFRRYWWTNPNSPSPEPRVIDRLAVQQIMPLLSPRQRESLTMLATVEDYDQAAAAMGIAPGTFRVLISSARRRFLAAWHEGEAPSRAWQMDRRRRAARDRYGKQRITASQLDAIRARRDAGETLAAIGRDYGVGKACISSLLTGRTRPAPDHGAARNDVYGSGTRAVLNDAEEDVSLSVDNRLPPVEVAASATSTRNLGSGR